MRVRRVREAIVASLAGIREDAPLRFAAFFFSSVAPCCPFPESLALAAHANTNTVRN